MKIITWNCNMAFRKKAAIILPYNPDILVVQECEHPDKLLFPDNLPKPTDMLWFGKNQHKGMAIFSYGRFRFTVHSTHNQDLQMIIPILVTGGQLDFNLFAIWANNPADKDGQYVEQIWKAIHHYDALLSSGNNILIGDFNSNTIWDRKYRESNHSNVVQFLAGKSIASVYHKQHRQTQGAERDPTLYLYRHKDKPYHLDYCFASALLMEKLQAVDIGNFSFWTKYSDHTPVMATFSNC